jgi:hypothetical protein
MRNPALGNRQRQLSTPPRRSTGQAAMAGMGHEERFPQTRMSAGCGFRKETIVGMRRNGRDAPTADFGPFYIDNTGHPAKVIR